MRKLIVTCQCGQRMQVPRSAVGKTGLCPTCGQMVTISNDNAAPTGAGPKGPRPLSSRQVWWQGRVAPPEDAKRKFGEAVDLYYAGRYGEALAIFDALAKQFPDNPDIENGRTQCMAALRRPPMAIEDRTGGSAAAPLRDGKLDEETVRRVILEKLLHGATESVQLQAAELAARLLGMFPNGHKPAEAEPPAPEPPSGAAEPPQETGNAEPAPPPADRATDPPGDTPIPNESDLEDDLRRAVRL